MIDWSYFVAKIFTTVASWIDAGNLRNKVYQQAEEAEIMMTAVEDIERMSTEPKIKQYARRAIESVKGLPVEDSN